MSKSPTISKTRTSSIVAAGLALSLLAAPLCLAEPTRDALQLDAQSPADDDSMPRPEQPILAPEEESGACPIRDEDVGQSIALVDRSFLPQVTLFAAEKIDRWGGGGGDTCNISLCCGPLHCQPPEVEPECAGDCNLTTFLCEPY